MIAAANKSLELPTLQPEIKTIPICTHLESGFKQKNNEASEQVIPYIQWYL